MLYSRTFVIFGAIMNFINKATKQLLFFLRKRKAGCWRAETSQHCYKLSWFAPNLKFLQHPVSQEDSRNRCRQIQGSSWILNGRALPSPWEAQSTLQRITTGAQLWDRYSCLHFKVQNNHGARWRCLAAVSLSPQPLTSQQVGSSTDCCGSLQPLPRAETHWFLRLS